MFLNSRSLALPFFISILIIGKNMKEEFGLRVVDVVQGDYKGHHVLIDIDEERIIIHGGISSKKYDIKNDVVKIENILDFWRY